MTVRSKLWLIVFGVGLGLVAAFAALRIWTRVDALGSTFRGRFGRRRGRSGPETPVDSLMPSL